MNELANINKLEDMMAQLIQIQTETQTTILETKKDIESVRSDVGNLNSRVGFLETKEEIEYEKQVNINDLISSVVYDRLGISGCPSKWTLEERTINAKYGRLFRRRLRKEVAGKGHLAWPFRTTQKGNYLLACKDIEAWYPRNGVEALKREADENAIARKTAKEQGYI